MDQKNKDNRWILFVIILLFCFVCYSSLAWIIFGTLPLTHRKFDEGNERVEDQDVKLLGIKKEAAIFIPPRGYDFDYDYVNESSR